MQSAKLQLTPNNSNLLAKWKKVRVIRKNIWKKANGWGGNASTMHTSLQGQQKYV